VWRRILEHGAVDVAGAAAGAVVSELLAELFRAVPALAWLGVCVIVSLEPVMDSTWRVVGWRHGYHSTPDTPALSD
jgi:hypothetical protein